MNDEKIAEIEKNQQITCNKKNTDLSDSHKGLRNVKKNKYPTLDIVRQFSTTRVQNSLTDPGIYMAVK